MQNTKSECFPKNSAEALAMLWLRSQDLSDKTPEQVSDMFWDAYFRIVNRESTSQDAAKQKSK